MFKKIQNLAQGINCQEEHYSLYIKLIIKCWFNFSASSSYMKNIIQNLLGLGASTNFEKCEDVTLQITT